MSSSAEKISGYKRPSELPIKGSLSDTDVFLVSDGVDLYQVSALTVKNYTGGSKGEIWIEQENPDTPVFPESSETILSIDISGNSTSQNNKYWFDDYIGSYDPEKIKEIHIKLKDRNSLINYHYDFSWDVDNTTGTPTSKSPKNKDVDLFVHYNVLDAGSKLTSVLFNRIRFDWNTLKSDGFNKEFYIFSGITKKEYSDDVKTYRSFTPYYLQFDNEKYTNGQDLNCYKNVVGKEYALTDFTKVSDSNIADVLTEFGVSFEKGQILQSIYLYQTNTLDKIKSEKGIIFLCLVIDITADSSTYDFSFLNSPTVFNKSYSDLGLKNNYTGVKNTIITSFTGEQYVGNKAN